MIAFYNQDSIAIQMKEAKPFYNSIAASEANLYTIREKQIPATDRLLTAKSDSAKSKTPQGKKEIQSAQNEVYKLRDDSLKEELNISTQYKLLAPTYKKIKLKADSVGTARGVKQVRESGDNSPMICPTDQMLMMDITNEVAIAMGMKPKLVKIGIYNQDSLMRLMPGYARIKDSLNIDRSMFEAELEKRNAQIDKEAHELDSLRPKIKKREISRREKHLMELTDERDMYRGWTLYNLDMADSNATKIYREKFYRALREAHKQYGCVYSHEYARAHADWKLEEAEFIDLNKYIAGKLIQN
jgi:Skp family chaperone for outer membrane proteins